MVDGILVRMDRNRKEFRNGRRRVGNLVDEIGELSIDPRDRQVPKLGPNLHLQYECNENDSGWRQGRFMYEGRIHMR